MAGVDLSRSCRRRIYQSVALFLIVGSMPTSSAFAQQEISLFRLTDVSGSFDVSYAFDERSDGQAQQIRTVRADRLREELRFNTRSYFYHPAFLDMRISGGPVFSQTARDDNGSSSKDRDTLFNYDVLLNFLSRKAFPFSLYFGERNPESSTGVAGTYNVKERNYGLRGTLRQPLTPIHIDWGAEHRDSVGGGFGATIDDATDLAYIRASLSYAKSDHLQLNLNWNERTSQSGSPGLPIRETVNETQTAQLSGRNEFGEDVKLTQNLSHFQQQTAGINITDVDTLRYNGVLSWNNSSRLGTIWNLQYFDTDRDGQWQTSGASSVAANYIAAKNLRLKGKASFSRSDRPGFSQDAGRVRASANYARSLPYGRLSLTGGMTLGRTDRNSTQESVEVFDESILLVGSIPIALEEEFVVVETVVVTNVAQTQVFVEGLDYRLVTIGSTTTIERIVTGNILDGQEVLVSYRFLTGGTVEYETQSETVGANLSLWNRANLFINYSNSTSDVLSGTATTPLNDSRSIEAGGDLSVPLIAGWSAGGNIRYRKQIEDISPSSGVTIDTSINSASYWNTRLRIGAGWRVVDYESSREDIDAIRFSLNVQSVLPGGIALSYRSMYSKDDGGSIFKENRRNSLQLTWRYRLVSLTLNASRVDSWQGDLRRKDTEGTVFFRRFFL